jgi:hypothetical protein
MEPVVYGHGVDANVRMPANKDHGSFREKFLFSGEV